MLQSMNPLFLGLLIAGAALVFGVVVVNWLQERRVRRRIDAAFHKPGDASHYADRVEPMLPGANLEGEASARVDDTAAEADDEAHSAGADAEFEALAAVPARTERGDISPDADIECVVALQPQQPVPTVALAEALAAKMAKPVRWLGRRGPGLPWQLVDATANGPWVELAACLLLANRAGAATRDDIDAFERLLSQVAAGIHADFALPDVATETTRAEALDRFCADLDVQIGLTILKGEAGQIAGTRLRGVAEAAGFRLTAAGQFDYVDETGATLYSLQNHKQEPFTVESLRVLITPGVVFLLDVPRVADSVRVFDQMRLSAKRMTQTLEGVLVDDNRRALTDASLAAIRAQVQATAAALREAHIDPGGPRALRLFG
jgi:ZipA, C-terminal FtsZ-binding domain